jgi:hypothetical protein
VTRAKAACLSESTARQCVTNSGLNRAAGVGHSWGVRLPWTVAGLAGVVALLAPTRPPTCSTPFKAAASPAESLLSIANTLGELRARRAAWVTAARCRH